MNENIIICPVCQKPLKINGKSAICPNKHNYDFAKSGYLNLLLNHNLSGDNEIMIKARHTFLTKGYFAPLLEKLISIIKSYQIQSILDVGCGEGYYSRHIYEALKINVWGVDISKSACLLASKKTKDVLYIVASNYNLPFSDKSFDGVINIFAPHSEELTRVARKLIIKVVPNINHLHELKEILYEDVYLKDSKEGNFFSFIKQKEELLTYKVTIDQLEDLIKMTPYFYKSKIDDKVLSMRNVKMTMNFKIIVYESQK